ncbi:TetR family transcriptional regulator [Nocardia sp. SYP-A9097]|uniref:TetR/AcrR family transcriptional regulator n=1 Tax=Nocardia sp. SYP-A9097 TaxID=2663237 RepID=UPI00129A9193|nr:TetR/AcrR family transcriptional regulator [Nocardia sp. SYP-A9097]MRH92343.1 TetR family transcriptional regulator [Nocardia sp. SYP-A9097]
MSTLRTGCSTPTGPAMLGFENDTFTAREAGKVTSAEQSRTNPIATAAIERVFDKHRGEYLAEAQRLIQACSGLIAETGQVDPSVNSILERSGLGTRAFYRLFNSKEELIIAVLQDGTNWKMGQIEEQMAQAGTPLERVRAWVEAAISPYFRDTAPGHRAILLHTYRWEMMFPTEIAAMRDQLLRPLVRAIAELRGENDSTSAHNAAEIIYDSFFGVACRAEAQRRLVEAHEVTALARLAELIAERFE